MLNDWQSVDAGGLVNRCFQDTYNDVLMPSEGRVKAINEESCSELLPKRSVLFLLLAALTCQSLPSIHWRPVHVTISTQALPPSVNVHIHMNDPADGLLENQSFDPLISNGLPSPPFSPLQPPSDTPFILLDHTRTLAVREFWFLPRSSRPLLSSCIDITWSPWSMISVTFLPMP